MTAAARDASRFRVVEVRLYERDVTMRLPFRFGPVTLTEAPQAFARVGIRTANGRRAWGRSAELLAPKWFDKTPDLTDVDNSNQLRAAAQMAARRYMHVGGPHSAFGLFAACHADHVDECAAAGLNGLVAGFGTALLDRAILDALCRTAGISVFDAVRANLPGIDPAALLPEFGDFGMMEFLGELTAPSRIAVRHTIGMADPIIGTDLTPETDRHDGLPVTLEQVIAAYGHRHFKITVGRDIEAAVDRLVRIAAVLDQLPKPYLVTIDGGEQFTDLAGVTALWAAIDAAPALDRLRGSIAFIEQPLDRAVTFDVNISAVGTETPFIIDEADSDLYAFTRARAVGYRGVSYKGCKGIYKGLINAARCRMWNAEIGGPYFSISAEDLGTQAGISLQQDTAFAALLGVDHVQRNGHHYVNGMSGVPMAEADAFLRAHPDLYHLADGTVRLTLRDGYISLATLNGVGFAADAEPDWRAMREMPMMRR